MFTKEEASRLKGEFWTVFGQYMAPVLSSEGEKVNWVNYKTGEKDIFFRMQAENKKAVIGIVLAHKDLDIQQIYYEQFEQLKNFLEAAVEEEWQWHLHTTDEYGKIVSKIFMEVNGFSIFKKEDWPALISFFKKRMMGLDEFWSNVKYGFESLR